MRGEKKKRAREACEPCLRTRRNGTRCVSLFAPPSQRHPPCLTLSTGSTYVSKAALSTRRGGGARCSCLPPRGRTCPLRSPNSACPKEPLAGAFAAPPRPLNRCATTSSTLTQAPRIRIAWTVRSCSASALQCAASSCAAGLRPRAGRRARTQEHPRADAVTHRWSTRTLAGPLRRRSRSAAAQGQRSRAALCNPMQRGHELRKDSNAGAPSRSDGLFDRATRPLWRLPRRDVTGSTGHNCRGRFGCLQGGKDGE